jgi:hypothetical protein
MSWAIPVIMLRSSDWNAHVHNVPPPPEDPPSNNPHPTYGPEITAEQLYQRKVANWLQQNLQQGGGAGQNQNIGHHHNVQQVLGQQHLGLQLQQNLNLNGQQLAPVAPPLYNF